MSELPINLMQPIKEVLIDGIAVLKIIKHCTAMLPQMVAGSLLGLDNNGVLEVTYAYPFPSPDKNDRDDDDTEGRDYQLDMMNMLRDVNIDNNTIGWYQSTYLSTMCTNDVVTYQYSYQSSDELSDNSIVIMYDPILAKTDKGKLSLKAYRLSAEYIELRRNKKNVYIDPSNILEELPIRIKNEGFLAGYTDVLSETHEEEISQTACQSLSLSNNESYNERNLELMTSWVEDLIAENKKFQDYVRNTRNIRGDHRKWAQERVKENKDRFDNGELPLPYRIEDAEKLKHMPEPPTRTEPLLMIGQLDKYVEQVSKHVDASLQKLALVSNLNNLS